MSEPSTKAEVLYAYCDRSGRLLKSSTRGQIRLFSEMPSAANIRSAESNFGQSVSLREVVVISIAPGGQP
jgi:hypothetical protein